MYVHVRYNMHTIKILIMYVHVRYHSYVPFFLLLRTRQQHIQITITIATRMNNNKAPPAAAAMGIYTGNVVVATVASGRDKNNND